VGVAGAEARGVLAIKVASRRSEGTTLMT
jgi:hypothetical protein